MLRFAAPLLCVLALGLTALPGAEPAVEVPSCCGGQRESQELLLAATCTGSAAGRACTTCSSCRHCRNGGTCGVCAGNSRRGGRPNVGFRATPSPSPPGGRAAATPTPQPSRTAAVPDRPGPVGEPVRVMVIRPLTHFLFAEPEPPYPEFFGNVTIPRQTTAEDVKVRDGQGRVHWLLPPKRGPALLLTDDEFQQFVRVLPPPPSPSAIPDPARDAELVRDRARSLLAQARALEHINRDGAVRYYRDILALDLDSGAPERATATDRLRALGVDPGPSGAPGPAAGGPAGVEQPAISGRAYPVVRVIDGDAIVVNQAG